MNYLTVILSRPKVTLVFCLNKLGGDSHSIRFAPHTGPPGRIGSEVHGRSVHWLPAVLVLHDGSAGDHTQVIWIKIAQLRDHLLREAVTEVVRLASPVRFWNGSTASINLPFSLRARSGAEQCNDPTAPDHSNRSSGKQRFPPLVRDILRPVITLST